MKFLGIYTVFRKIWNLNIDYMQSTVLAAVVCPSVCHDACLCVSKIKRRPLIGMTYVIVHDSL